jgi:membrane associated rhomboid family serine protease
VPDSKYIAVGLMVGLLNGVFDWVPNVAAFAIGLVGAILLALSYYAEEQQPAKADL